jgi:iron-sulfur cluster assembly protein
MSISLSEAAAARIRSYMAQQSAASAMRLGVKKTGCSGFAYVVELTSRVDESDHVFDTDGIRIVIDNKSLPFLDGTRIDFTRQGLNEMFEYDNPNVKSLCGCGESFGI